MKTITKIKINSIKALDWLNDKFYYYSSQPLMSADDKTLSELEDSFYQDIIDNHIDPDGFYAYGYHIDRAVTQDKWYPLSGDQCLHQGLLIGMMAFKCVVLRKNYLMTIEYDDYYTECIVNLKKLINAMCSLVTNDGKLLRGRTAWYKEGREGEWKRTLYEVNSNNVSGDQLGGFVFGMSVVKYLVNIGEFELSKEICQLIDGTVKRLYEDMQSNCMMLTDLNNEPSTGEFPYWSWKAINGQATTVLALTLLAGDFYFADNLIYKYDYDKLCQYSESHWWGWNNWFMANITAISLFAIWTKIGSLYNAFAVKGLERIAYNTRDWGHGLFNLLWNFVTPYESSHKVNDDQIRSWLASYNTLEIPEPIKKGRTWFFKKWQTALPCRARYRDTDFMPQRELLGLKLKDFSDPLSPEGIYPNHKFSYYYGRHDYCLLKAICVYFLIKNNFVRVN